VAKLRLDRLLGIGRNFGFAASAPTILVIEIKRELVITSPELTNASWAMSSASAADRTHCRAKSRRPARIRKTNFPFFITGDIFP